MKKNEVLQYIYKKKFYLSLLACICIVAVVLFVTNTRKSDIVEIADLNEVPSDGVIVENTISNNLVENDPLYNIEATVPDITIEQEADFINEEIAISIEDSLLVPDNTEVEIEDDAVVETFADGSEEDEIVIAIEEEEIQELEELEEEQNQELKPVITIEQPNVSFELENGIIMPLEGEIILPFNDSTPVYFKTLEQYKINTGLFIGADVGAEVKAATDGIVDKVEYIDDKGYVITVYHGNGYKSIYGQLSEDMNVAEGDVISEGWVIGYVEQVTSYYALEGTHLYFEFSEDEEPIDPVQIFK